MRSKNHGYLLACLLPLGLAALAAGGGGCGGDSATTGGGGSATTQGTGGKGTGGQGTGATSTGGGGSNSGGSGGTAPDRQVVVLFTSDEHSHLFAFSPELDDFPMATTPGTGTLVGGVARRVAVLAKERQAAKDAKKDSILVSAGDNQMGCLTHVAFQEDSVDYGTMKTLGYDVTTFGNHEFDFGPKALANSINAAKTHAGLPPIVASNIHFSSTSPDDDTLAALYSKDVTDSAPVHPYRVVTTDSGIKIGVIGYVGVNASHVAPNKTPVAFSESGLPAADDGVQAKVLPSLYKDLQPVVDTLHNTEKVDLVIALAHGGINDTSSEAGIEAGDDWNVCKNVTGIDFIVSGHAHNPDPKPIEVVNTANKNCLVLNGSSFGQHVGRVEFTIPGDSSKPVSWDKATQTLIPVNDETVPDTTEAAAVPALMETIEEAGTSLGGGSYLEGLLSTTTGTTITNNTTTPGDLYFYPIGKTAFDIVDTHSILFLSADSMLSASDKWAVETTGPATDFAVESAGVIRGVIKQGKTGVISASDAFNIVPLGSSPTDDGTVGYPLIRASLLLLEIRGVFEFSLAEGPTNNDLDLGMSGVQVEYDATRPFATSTADLLDPTKGQVMKITLASDHTNLETFDKVIYDRVGMIGGTTDIYSVVTSSYIGQFAGDAGVKLRDATGTPLGPVPYDNNAAVELAVLHRTDTSEIKQIEGFFQWIYSMPTLSTVYQVTSPQAAKRWVCTNGC